MASRRLIVVWSCLMGALCATGMARRAQPASRNLTLTAVDGIKVGHFTLTARPTGCTVILVAPNTRSVSSVSSAAVDVRGAAPGTRETDRLDPGSDLSTVSAIVLSGGSAYGLDVAPGVMKWLDERRIGQPVDTPGGVPIVPSAVLIDLWFGGDPRVRPGADCGYRAAQSASSAPVEEGNVGAGAGATIGKFLGHSGAMKAGIGSSAIELPSGLVVAAIVAVNAMGDIVDPQTGKVIAGMRAADGGLADVRRLLRSGQPSPGGGANTTIGVVATNARLSTVQAKKVAEMAHDGYARAIFPSHTMGDGDTIFALATGGQSGSADVSRIGTLAATVMADAIVRAATQATSIPGYPAARDLK
jgi:L-aminopeptidase/D-esterase-like protein